MDLINAYRGEKERKAKNDKNYKLVRTVMYGEQKRNIYSKNSLEYIKHNGKFMQLKKYNEMRKKKHNELMKKQQKKDCKKDCKAENKICNKKTLRCNKIKEEKVPKEKKVPKRVAAKKQRDEEVYKIFYQFFVEKRAALWNVNHTMDDNELSTFIRQKWNNPVVDTWGFTRDDYYRMTKKLKKPHGQISMIDLETVFLRTRPRKM